MQVIRLLVWVFFLFLCTLGTNTRLGLGELSAQRDSLGYGFGRIDPRVDRVMGIEYGTWNEGSGSGHEKFMPAPGQAFYCIGGQDSCSVHLARVNCSVVRDRKEPIYPPLQKTPATSITLGGFSRDAVQRDRTGGLQGLTMQLRMIALYLAGEGCTTWPDGH